MNHALEPSRMSTLMRSACVVVLLWLCLPGTIPRVTAQAMSEYQLKAAFLVNFGKFIDWPDPAFASSTSPFVIGVVGDDPFGGDLDKAIAGKLVGAHPIVAKRVNSNDDMADLELVFIGSSETPRLADILRRLNSSSAVTVSDIDRFCDAGGIIAFVVDNNRIRFEVNLDAAQKRNVKISSKLLSLALIHKAGH
jgi:hypothetical protein